VAAEAGSDVDVISMNPIPLGIARKIVWFEPELLGHARPSIDDLSSSAVPWRRPTAFPAS
jgi:hypothetical protein